MFAESFTAEFGSAVKLLGNHSELSGFDAERAGPFVRCFRRQFPMKYDKGSINHRSCCSQIISTNSFHLSRDKRDCSYCSKKGHA